MTAVPMFAFLQRGLPTLCEGGGAATGQGAPRRRVQLPLSDQVHQQRRRHGRLESGRVQGPPRARRGRGEGEGEGIEEEEKQLR